MVYPWEAAGRFRMTSDIWKGQRIFYLGGTLAILVTDDVREALLRARPSNVSISDAGKGAFQ
jgi:hypothetical protein